MEDLRKEIIKALEPKEEWWCSCGLLNDKESDYCIDCGRYKNDKRFKKQNY
jgi:hypothetical protein